MKVPYGYCDLRVERVNDSIINTFIECKYRLILYNCSIINHNITVLLDRNVYCSVKFLTE